MAGTMNIAIIQARMNSQRLPGKVLMDICGKKVIDHVYERVNKAKLVDKVYIATGIDHCNDPIVEHCIKHGYNYYVGEQDNVLKRYYDLASIISHNPEDKIVRITCDCPLVDPIIIDNMIMDMDLNKYGYYGNQDKHIDGFDVEIMLSRILQFIYHTQYEDEHVTLKYKKEYADRINYYPAKKDLHGIHLSLDTPEDYNYIRNIFEKLYWKNPNFGYEEVVKSLGY